MKEDETNTTIIFFYFLFNKNMIVFDVIFNK